MRADEGHEDCVVLGKHEKKIQVSCPPNHALIPQCNFEEMRGQPSIAHADFVSSHFIQSHRLTEAHPT